MKVYRRFLNDIRKRGVKRREAVCATAMGVERVFDAFDLGDDTFIFERGIASRLDDRPSVLMVAKSHLRRRTKGYVLTITTGNHSVAAFPLLDGRFWKLSTLPREQRGSVLMNSILCANIVEDRLEISQRDIATSELAEIDGWLTSALTLSIKDVIMIERNPDTIDYYHRRGQEWRVKALAWTAEEMRIALEASRRSIASKIRYYHSARGVHFFTLPEFRCFAALAETDFEEFVKGLKELVSVYEGNQVSFTRLFKYRGHHEIEFFGIRRGYAVERLVPELEALMEQIALDRLGRLGVIQRINEITDLFASMLTKVELGDEKCDAFTDTLYMYITGEIYSTNGEGTTPEFDDRRTALPGATFVNGRVVMHPGSDDRSEVLLSNLRGLMSKDEIVEYANVYELRGDDGEVPIGHGKTREIVYKSNRAPLEISLIEKRLAKSTRDYGSYLLVRVGSLRALGITLSPKYRLLRRRAGAGKRPVDFYIRHRCEGEPMWSIPETFFRRVDDSTRDDSEVILMLAQLMGDAAAQNMTMKKFDPKSNSPLFGIGKEIYDFEYDIPRQRVMPKSVATCSIRGSLGWPCLNRDEENLERVIDFYFSAFAQALVELYHRHPASAEQLAERFMDGFEFRTHALAWKLAVMRDQFEVFDPGLPKVYDFKAKWAFVMWSLERQERRLNALRKLFTEKFKELIK